MAMSETVVTLAISERVETLTRSETGGIIAILETRGSFATFKERCSMLIFTGRLMLTSAGGTISTAMQEKSTVIVSTGGLIASVKIGGTMATVPAA